MAEGICDNPACRAPLSESRVGVVVRGVYDGALFWLCSACNHAWPRFERGHLGTLSKAYAEKHNRS